MATKILTATCLLGLCLALVACVQMKEENTVQAASKISLAERYAAIHEWMDNNPCGVLRMRQPVFNVNGVVTADVKPGSHVYLNTAHNTTYTGAIYAVDHCRAITRLPIAEDNSFTITSLPAGTYVLSVPIDSFGPAQGFPVVEEFNRSGHTLDVAFHGGDYRHSLGAFTIKPIS